MSPHPPVITNYAAQVHVLQQLDSLQSIPESELLILAQHAVLRTFEPQAVISAERSVSRAVWLLLAGNVEQTMRDADGTDVTLSLMGRGDVFGEGGLFGVRYRRTTVSATTRTYLLQFSYAFLQHHAAQLPHVFTLLRLRFREQLLQTTLARVPMLASLNPLERLSIAAQLDDRRVDRNEVVLTEGEMGDGLYIVAEGQASVIRHGHTIAVMEPGDVFGEMSLLDGMPHDATVRALTPLHLLFLPLATFNYLFSQRTDVAVELHNLARRRRQTDRTPEHIATTEQMIELGVIRGKQVLVRRVEHCDPDCRRCEDACQDRFGLSRLHFSNNRIGDVEIADVCHHCQWGVECVASCPEDAFKLDDSGHFVITDRCTGCGECVTACPYNAINQIPIYPSISTPVAWFQQVIVHRQPLMLRANKCDACYGYDDHACVSACPAGALAWIPVEALYNHTTPTETA